MSFLVYFYKLADAFVLVYLERKEEKKKPEAMGYIVHSGAGEGGGSLLNLEVAKKHIHCACVGCSVDGSYRNSPSDSF